MGGSGTPDENADGSKKAVTRKLKGKGNQEKTRFQLFDPSSKADLINLCESGLAQLSLQDNKNLREIDEREKDNCRDLDFDGESSDDEDVDKLPRDSGKVGENAEISLTQQSRRFCGSCNVTFYDLTEQRVHYTLDWHRYNVKRKLHGQGFVTEARFDEMIDDLSSIDGSDNEEEDTTPPVTLQVDRLLEKLTTSGETLPPPPADLKLLSSSQKLERSTKTFFKNNKGQIITCFKTVLSSHNTENQEGNKGITSSFVNCIKTPLRITIIMASGGHFAAAVFEGNSCTQHKTFHSYTVRAKQGGSQGGHDAKSGTSNAKSAGASLRRYNQQSFTQHVQDLLGSWKKNIAESNLVFYKAVSANSNILFTGKNPPLDKDSKSLRTIPFPTKRPTFSEIKRVHSLLTTVHLYDSMDSFLTAHSHLVKNENSNEKSPDSPSKKKNKKAINRAKSRSPKRKDEFDIRVESDENSNDENICQQLEQVDQVVDFNELKEYDDSLTSEQRKLGKRKKPKKPVAEFKLEGILGDLNDALQLKNSENFKILLDKLKDSNTDPNIDINQSVDLQGSTLLHIASKTNQLDIVWDLMEAGCDPAAKDKSGKYPYNYAESRECRDVFRKFMGEYPEIYDYKKAQVPPPLSEEMEKERAEKKKLLNKMKREKEKQKKMERKEKDKETEEQRRYLNLSDREKRALAAEQRILAQCKKNSEKAPVLVRCFECAADMTGKVPFEYNQNVFCTTKCLAAHRKKFPCPLSV